MCYQGNCVDSRTFMKNATAGNPCSPNPCMNGGLCALNSTTNTISCKCTPGKSYSGKIKVYHYIKN